MKHPKNKQLSSESQFSVLPVIEAAGNTLPPGLVLDPDVGDSILTFIDREHYGGIHTVESGRTYTIRLGLHRKLKKSGIGRAYRYPLQHTGKSSYGAMYYRIVLRSRGIRTVHGYGRLNVRLPLQPKVCHWQCGLGKLS